MAKGAQSGTALVSGAQLMSAKGQCCLQPFSYLPAPELQRTRKAPPQLHVSLIAAGMQVTLLYSRRATCGAS